MPRLDTAPENRRLRGYVLLAVGIVLLVLIIYAIGRIGGRNRTLSSTKLR